VPASDISRGPTNVGARKPLTRALHHLHSIAATSLPFHPGCFCFFFGNPYCSNSESLDCDGEEREPYSSESPYWDTMTVPFPMSTTSNNHHPFDLLPSREKGKLLSLALYYCYLGVFSLLQCHCSDCGVWRSWLLILIDAGEDRIDRIRTGWSVVKGLRER
jgi:hypothetical protein